MISTRLVELVIDTVGAVAKADPIRRPCTIETGCEWATARVRARRLRRPISSGLRLRRLGRLGFSCWRDRAVPPGPIHAKLFSVNALDTCAMGGIEDSFTLGPRKMPTPSPQ